LTLGRSGIPEAAENAVLNANYLMARLKECYTMAYDVPCMHEFVMTLEPLKKECGVSAMDIAKSLLDAGMHPPTMYFPLIVHEALMVEPTETDSKETLDAAADAYLAVYRAAAADPERAHHAPHNAAVGRPDEVAAARNPKLRYRPQA
ncbi:MAG: aminomethyl-transferring glycine dehydrogenase subunit GcvPB, partial [Oscillospiraceae bacterium]